jgi:hypothetical protein
MRRADRRAVALSTPRLATPPSIISRWPASGRISEARIGAFVVLDSREPADSAAAEARAERSMKCA